MDLYVHNTIQLINRAYEHGERTAVIDSSGRHSYTDLLQAAEAVAATLLETTPDLQETPIAFMVPAKFEYVAVQWGIWLAGGIAVPLCVSHPLPEIDYVLEDTGAAVLVCDADFAEKLRPLAQKKAIQLVLTTETSDASQKPLPDVDSSRRAMILYTSGTTSKPKGVVATHQNISAQIKSLVEAWGWTSNDHILHVLPLHHTHGIINVLSCALWSGAVCQFLPKFDAEEVWRCFLEDPLTLFMAVPTIYARLIRAWEKTTPENQAHMSKACEKFRLMVSGSAALPVPFFKKWQKISGHALLERYGMTEIGMALSNPLKGERRPGYVGQPLPGVTVRVINETEQDVTTEGEPGELHIKGENVFKEYWQKPEATEAAFSDGWFRTGDEVIVEDGYFRILGRQSVDIIKTGGYKVSALEIETVLLSHPAISECAVVSIPDEEWGESVCVAAVLKKNASLTLQQLRDWAKERLAIYKIPTHLLCVQELPRNVLGKVTKPDLKKLFG